MQFLSGGRRSRSSAAGRKRHDHDDCRAAARLWRADDARPDRGAGAAADRRAGGGQGLRRRAEPRARREQFLRQAHARQQDDAAAAGDFRPRSGRRRRQGRRAGLGGAPRRAGLCQSGAVLRLMPDVPQRPDAGLSELDAARLLRSLAGHHAGLSLRRARPVHHRAGQRAGQAARYHELRDGGEARLSRHRLCGDEKDRCRSRTDAT